MNIQEQQWVEAAKRGDQDAFACLVGAYEKRVFALTIRMCKQPEDAAEAAQEAFLAVWQGLPSFRGEASFSTWLYRLASNACVDILRRESRRRETLFLDGEEAPADVPDRGPTRQEAAEQQELRREIEAGLAALPPEYRQALILREIHQLSYQEIGEALGISRSYVSRIEKKALSKLREKFEK